MRNNWTAARASRQVTENKEPWKPKALTNTTYNLTHDHGWTEVLQLRDTLDMSK
jgi:hypothetical protein